MPYLNLMKLMPLELEKGLLETDQMCLIMDKNWNGIICFGMRKMKVEVSSLLIICHEKFFHSPQSHCLWLLCKN